MNNVQGVLDQQAADALQRLGITAGVTASEIADSVLRQAVYWEKPLPDGSQVLFVRLFSPVIQREEVFLGNVLFNAFLGQTFARAVKESGLGQIEPVANDLENYYFLAHTTAGIEQLVATFRAEVARNLPNLFFGDANEDRGIYGSLETMLDFQKANVEPFPVFIMPLAYAKRLEKAVRTSLLHKIEKSTFERNPTSIMANLAFFYSHDGAEMQSPPEFLSRLAFDYFPLSKELERALNIPLSSRVELEARFGEWFTEPQQTALAGLLDHIEEISYSPHQLGWVEIFFVRTEKGEWTLDSGKPKDQKPVSRLLSKIVDMPTDKAFSQIRKSVAAYRLSDVSVCSKTDLRNLLRKLVEQLAQKAEQESEGWLLPYVRTKLLAYDETVLVMSLLEGVSIGYIQAQASRQKSNMGCRICGMQPVEVEEKNILMGLNIRKFHNQSGKQGSSDKPKTCLRCATYTYLMVKLLGSEVVGQYQVPKTYNLIFHYGQHTNVEVAQLTARMDLVWDLLAQRNSLSKIRWDIDQQRKTLAQKIEKQRNTDKIQLLAGELAQKEEELQQAQNAITQTDARLLTVCPWLQATNVSFNPAEIPSVDVMANSQLSATKTERHILGLGMGGYRMILFVLPQIRAPRDAKEHDFAQRRFSNSRITVTTFLSFLRQLCGCDGPFYYQSLPTLAPGAFQSDTFYVRDEPINVTRVQQEYLAVAELVWRLLKRRQRESPPEFLVRKIILAERMLAEPLETISEVMRDSPIIGKNIDFEKDKYKRLPGASIWRKEWGNIQDLTEYAQFIQQFSQLEEVK